MNRSFLKMHGLGNDFVILDGRKDALTVDADYIRSIADRKRGIGCDQIVILQKPKSPGADVYMDMYNADGSVVRACGNVTRCVARLMFKELNKKSCVIETVAGLLPSYEDRPGMIAVDFGAPRLAANEIPLAKDIDTLHVPLTVGALSDACCINMGNPHAVFFVADAGKIPLAEVGPKIEHDALFPDRINVEIAQVIAKDRIRMRVWERGAGITEACGSGACAVLVATVRRGLSDRRATIMLDGGDVTVEWRTDNHVLLIGPAAQAFSGTMEDEIFTAAKRRTA